MGFNNNFGCDDCRRGHDRFDRRDRYDRYDRYDRRDRRDDWDDYRRPYRPDHRRRPNRGPEVGLFFGFPRFFR